jgi:hypothetical protein
MSPHDADNWFSLDKSEDRAVMKVEFQYQE